MQDERIPTRIKFIYSLGEFAPSVAVGTIIPFYFLYFLTDVAHVPPGLAGTLLLVARTWDAINDPLVGNLSDRTHSRWGRRRPYILFAAIPMGLLFGLLWIVPPFEGMSRALYYLLIYLIFDTVFTMVQGPYTALTPEMSLDADERTSLVVWRMAVSIITGLVAAVAMEFVFSAIPDLRVRFGLMGAAVGLIGILPYLWIAAVVRERPEFQHKTGFGFVEAMKTVLSNRVFWLAMAADTLVWTAIGIVEAVFAYYLIYWSGIPEDDSPLIMALILGSAALFLPLVNWLAHRLEKKWAFVICTATWTLVHGWLWFIAQGASVPIYFVAVLAGLGVSSAHVLPGAMGIDVLEAVELDSGTRQEGVFVGVNNFIRKFGISLALFALGWVLDLTDYVPNAASQSAPALAGIRIMISWIPFALLGLAIIAASAFPITREVHARMVAELVEREAESSAD